MESLKVLFTTICNMSATAGFVILLVNFARFFLQRAPRKYSYYLWGVVGFRLICPFSFSSMFSIFNLAGVKELAVSGSEMNWTIAPEPNSYGEVVFKAPNFNHVMWENQSVGNGWTVGITDIVAAVWILGMILFLGYQFWAFLKLKNNLEMAVRTENDIFEAEGIKEPFVMGILKPRIYIPFHLKEAEREYILLHEKYHIKRKDHIVKIAAVVLLGVHWFNPLVWFSYFMMCKDMEMSCDEWVIEQLGKEKKQIYGYSLLDFAVDKKKWSFGTLAFGENAVKERVKNILKYRSPGKLVSVLSVIVCILAMFLGIANGTSQNAVRNVKQASEYNDGSVLEFSHEEDIKSYLIYYELYVDGKIVEYELCSRGSMCPTKTMTDFIVLEDSLRINVYHEGERSSGNHVIEIDEQKYGFDSYYWNYYLQGTSNWERFKPEKDFVLASFVFDRNESGGLQAYSCESYEDEVAKRSVISSNDGVLFIHLVLTDNPDYSDFMKHYRCSSFVRELYEAKNPYIGNHVADGAVIRALGIPSLGDFRTELQTAEEPYGMILHFDAAPVNETAFHAEMLERAALFLAVIENAGYFEWTYPSMDMQSIVQRRYNVDEIEQMLGIADLKAAYTMDLPVFNDFVIEVQDSDWALVEAEYVCRDMEYGKRPYTRKELITGRHPNASGDSTYLVYSYEPVTMEDITKFLFGSQFPPEKNMYLVRQAD